MKKAFLLLLALIITLSMLTACPGSTTPQGSLNQNTPPPDEQAPTENPATDFEYSDNHDGSITITKYIGATPHVVIPQKINDKPVTILGGSSFWNNQVAVSVKLSDSVTTIENGAFMECTTITKVELSQSLAYIGGGSFKNCTNLADIKLPTSLKHIGNGAFENCTSLKSISIPKSVTEWGFDSFLRSGLENLMIENGIEAIPDSTFGYTCLKEITLPSSVKTIGNGAFGGCANLESVVLNEGLLTIKGLAFGGQSKLTEIVIPKTVENIVELAFSGCHSLKKVKFQGHAPDNYVDKNLPFGAVDVHYTIYYHKDAHGFTSPEWNGYPTEIW